MVFRPFIDPMTMRPYQPPDKGYFFKLNMTDVKIVRYTLEDNGFRETKGKQGNWTILWSTSALKPTVYTRMQRDQRVNHFP